jgi:hypothetical protein
MDKVYGISCRTEERLKEETLESIQGVLSAISLAEFRHAVSSAVLRCDLCPRTKGALPDPTPSVNDLVSTAVH